MTRFTAPVNAPILRADQQHHKGSPAFDQSHHRLQPQTLEQFQAHIEHEFVIGSAIAPTLFAATIHIVSDTETLAGGEARYPIDEAFNWQPIRFGQQARATQYAALFTNEDGSVWQGKLSQSRIDKEKTKKKLKQASGKPAINSFEFWSLVRSHPEAVVYQKYETPIGKALSQGGSPRSALYLPTVPIAIRRRIARRYGITDPTFLPTRASRKQGIKMISFWEWIAAHPEIPIVWTEGGKKALCLLSQGEVAIVLYGVNGGYRAKDALGNPVLPYLAPDVARFAVSGRVNILAFDQDTSDTTRRRVNIATHRFSRLLQEATQQPTLITFWDGQQGKGVDDLMVNQGAIAWTQARTAALPLDHWAIWQHLANRLTFPVDLRVMTHDLSTLDLQDLPQDVILAIASGKGTGKTKFIAREVASTANVLSAGHRVALMRNLCDRLRLDYRGDLDKTNGRFITGAGYALRIGFCVDALLAIDPEQFRGCDLVIDEVVQVLRHLLTSSTCAKDGKRPALLARFQELVQSARRVIVADADLDNASLRYLQDLRGESELGVKAPVFLIQNDYQVEGYPVEFIECPTRSVIVKKLLLSVSKLQPGKVILVVTDTKKASKLIAAQIQKQYAHLRILVINSETSSCEAEREFITTPDAVLGREEYDVVIASPSMATGVSIEAQGVISEVYGVFNGYSATDADMAQALDRLREPVPRVVWCAEFGSNYSPVSRATNSMQMKQDLLEQTIATAQIVRSSLRADTLGATLAVSAKQRVNYDWRSDPNVTLWATLSADQNRSMSRLRTALLVRLRYEGKQVKVWSAPSDKAVLTMLRQVTQEINQRDAASLVAAPILTAVQFLALQMKEAHSPAEAKAIARFYLCQFYCIPPESLTIEQVLEDREGQQRGEILSLEAQLFPTVAVDRCAKALERQMTWNQGLCPWDISRAALRRELRQRLNLHRYFDVEREWDAQELRAIAQVARENAVQVKRILNFTIPQGCKENGKPLVSDVHIIHLLLSQMGIKVTFRWRGSGKDKHRVYRLNPERWEMLMGVIERRQLERESLGQSERTGGSPEVLIEENQTVGDPWTQESAHSSRDLQGVAQWLTPEVLVDVRSMWNAAAGDVEQQEALRGFVPDIVLEWACSSRYPQGVV
jgi:TusA-related sulfurtransferase